MSFNLPIEGKTTKLLRLNTDLHQKSRIVAQ